MSSHYTRGNKPTMGSDAIVVTPDITERDNLIEPEHNGSGSTSTSVAASGDAQIDGLLSGWRWSGPISYSDPDSSLDYQSGYFHDADGDSISVQNEGFSGFTGAQRVAAHFALSNVAITQPIGSIGFSVEGFTNLDTTYAGSGSGTGTIRLANSTDAGTAYAFRPHDSAYGGDAWFGPSGDSPTAGNYDWHTILHEVGHSLGLKHGQEAGGPGNTALPSNVDSLEYSAMTYRTYIGDSTSGYDYAGWNAPQTFMMLDIAALQHMYGADFSTNSGNTVYSWTSSGESYVNGNLAIDPGGNQIFSTVWDGGGRDTYDLSNYATSLNIDLRPGQHSTFSSQQLADLGGGPNGGFARGNVFNALLYKGDTRSLIEDVIGGSSNDAIYGNVANNKLDGGSGTDTMTGLGGNDLYIVRNATDIVDESLTGSGGLDTVQSSVSFSLANTAQAKGSIENLTLTGTAAINATGNSLANTLVGNSVVNTLAGGSGNDRLTGGSGNDRLTGGLANDTFRFNTALNATTNVDRITDCDVDNPTVVDSFDTIQLENAIFTLLTTTGDLAQSRFAQVSDATLFDNGRTITYVSSTGNLYYDTNGSTDGGATLFATLAPSLALTYLDFAVT